MRILKVIHGYPIRYNAGSEVYSQTLCHELVARGHEVQLFTREEDPFSPEYALRRAVDPDAEAVTLSLVNMARDRDRYRHAAVDQHFAELLDSFRPQVVHIGHLNHLSTSLVFEASKREIPIVFTLHDYWLMCPRGQFMQTNPEDPQDLWAACPGQDDGRCADRCYARCYGGDPTLRSQDKERWASWVKERMRHVREIVEHVDRFVAPSRYLLERFRADFDMPASKLVHLRYGFDPQRLAGRSRKSDDALTLGYIGTHIPAKGVHQLIHAFGQLRGAPRMRIYGRSRGQNTDALRALAHALPGHARERIAWLPEYRNQDIVREVFDRVDAIVVPSVWVENSPLVIQEALLAGVPVVTADTGGMAELVSEGANGLTYRFRDPKDLTRVLQRLVDEPDLLPRLSAGLDGAEAPLTIHAHVAELEELYASALRRRDAARVTQLPGPWRITFDTNPDDCNLRCVMCEEHSPHSALQRLRREQGRPPRRMDIALVERVVRDGAAHGLRELIPSTMGEPLLYKDFDRVIALCIEHNVQLNLTTNGTFPRLGARTWAEKLVPITSDVKISWNGATEETHNRIMLGAPWSKVLENAQTFLAVRDEHALAGGNRCRVTFQLTFLETNVAELPAIVALAAELGVDRVKGHHLWAHFPEIKDLSMRRSPAAIARWNRTVQDAERVADAQRLRDGSRVLLENIFELDLETGGAAVAKGVCPFLGQEAWVNASGRFNPCCAPDAERRSLGDFGDLTQQELSTTWAGETYQHLLTGYRTRNLCLSCNMRKQEPS